MTTGDRRARGAPAAGDAAPRSRVLVRVAPSVRNSADVSLLERAVSAALAHEGRATGCRLDVQVTDDTAIRALNRTHRGVDAVTDVLSFPLLAEPQGEAASAAFVLPPGEPLELGDIVLSWPRAVAQAAEYGHAVEREAAYLAIHGVLHLLGYDHERAEDAAVMRAQEEAILGALGLAR